jgi:plasmid stabilization system protein ParE
MEQPFIGGYLLGVLAMVKQNKANQSVSGKAYYYYRLNKKGIEIVRVLHQRMDLEHHL